MNALARAESAVGRWEKNGDLKKEAAYFFLLFTTISEEPCSTGFKFIKPIEYLGHQREKIRDIPDEMELYMVKKC
jgi:hypothetical protein